MKRSLWLSIALTGLLLPACISIKGSVVATSPTQDHSLLRHVVLFKFKEGTSPEQIATIENAFRQLPAKIAEIRDFEWGTDVNAQSRAEGFTHCFLLTFHDVESMEAYRAHQAHQDFVAMARPFLEKIWVIDYWPKE
ncbi:MAG: Dabb family protein [Candidatus Hydrogenedentes bacterium]|nr:Dabb family protein [Candidatus Hydrogenedentota bacterium]